MPIKTIIGSSGTIVSTIDPSKYVILAGLWDPQLYTNGHTLLTSVSGNAISVLLQGEFTKTGTGTVLSSPSWFGGIAPNNDANQYAQVIPGEYSVTTTMPNSQSPLVNYVICEGTFIVEVVRVIDDNNIVVKDPSGVTFASTEYTLTGFSAISYPIRNVTLVVQPSSTVNLWLVGQGSVELEEGTTATTLFFMGPQQREWGFLTKTKTGRDRWVKSEHYLTDWKPYHEKYVMSKANRKEK